MQHEIVKISTELRGRGMTSNSNVISIYVTNRNGKQTSQRTTEKS